MLTHAPPGRSSLERHGVSLTPYHPEMPKSQGTAIRHSIPSTARPEAHREIPAYFHAPLQALLPFVTCGTELDPVAS